MIVLNGKALTDLTDHKIIWLIDKMFQKYLQAVIASVLLKYPNIPLSKDHLYWEFMYLVPRTLREFNAKLITSEVAEVTYRTYLGTRLRYFAYSECQSWKRKTHEVLNQAHSYDDELIVASQSAMFTEQSFELNDSASNALQLDLSVLSPLEALICQAHFIDQTPLKALMLKHQLTRYKLNQVIHAIRHKLRSQVLKMQVDDLESDKA